jgi:tRNA(fMet)-specific endonuclease VapC
VKYLLDTCVISELISKRPHPGVVAWVDALDDEETFLSVITLGEVKRGIEKLSDSNRKSQLVQWLDDALLARFHGRIAGVDVDVMLIWGELVARLERRGRKLPAMDSIIAAIALRGDFTLVTRNVQDFEGTGVNVINPWL